MTLREFLEDAQHLKESYKDKEVVIKADNGLLLTPRIKLLHLESDFNLLTNDIDEIKQVIITC